MTFGATLYYLNHLNIFRNIDTSQELGGRGCSVLST